MADAGWYPDPVVAGQSRFWNGAAWTDQTSEPIVAAEALQPRSTIETTDEFEGTAGVSRSASVVFWAVGLGIVGCGIGLALTAWVVTHPGL